MDRIKQFIGWIIRVVQGIYNWAFKKPDTEIKRRRKICKECQWNNHGICDVCGCILKWKTASPNEKCAMNKW